MVCIIKIPVPPGADLVARARRKSHLGPGKGHFDGLEAIRALCRTCFLVYLAVDEVTVLTFQQIYFGISTPFSSLSLFTPSITAGLGFKDLRAQLMTVPPYAVACRNLNSLRGSQF